MSDPRDTGDGLDPRKEGHENLPVKKTELDFIDQDLTVIDDVPLLGGES